MNVTKPKPFVFVLMPFHDKFIDTYNLGIKPACIEAGAYAERLDEQIFQESMLQRIYNQINKADIIIADMTDRNPNVFYEVGYAHALNKRVILLTQSNEDIPFDLKHYTHIIYNNITELKATLLKWVSAYINKDYEDEELPDHLLKFYIDGLDLSKNPTIDCISKESVGDFISEIKIDFNNETKKFGKPIQFSIGLIFKHELINRFNQISDFNKILLPTGEYLYHQKTVMSLNPGSWMSVSFEYNCGSNFLAEDDVIIRIFYPNYYNDHEFILKFRKEDNDFPF